MKTIKAKYNNPISIDELFDYDDITKKKKKKKHKKAKSSNKKKNKSSKKSKKKTNKNRYKKDSKKYKYSSHKTFADAISLDAKVNATIDVTENMVSCLLGTILSIFKLFKH